MRWVWLLVLATTPLPAQASRPGAWIGQSLKRDLAWLCAKERRGRGVDPEHRVARFLAARFQKAGLVPLFQGSFFQGFRVAGLEGVNVGGLLPGVGRGKPGAHVILSAHHDHLGVRGGRIYPGAGDNAAGVAAMLAAVKLIRGASKPRVPVVFLAFDLEERGLLGSRFYASHPALPLKQIVTFITSDILGRSLMGLKGSYLAVLGTEHAPELAGLVQSSLEGAALKLVFVGSDAIGDRSDYAAFRNRGVPYVFFSTGENPDYHRPTDTLERLDLPLLVLQTRLIATFSVRQAQSGQRPPFRVSPVTGLLEMRSLAGLIDQLERRGAPPLRRLAKAARPVFQRLLKETRGGTPDRALLRSWLRRLLFGLRQSWGR